MKASTTVIINRNEIVPCENRAEWLSKYGVPANGTEVVVTADLARWSAAGVGVSTSGELVLSYGEPINTRDAIIKRIALGAQSTGKVAISQEELDAVLQLRASVLQSKRDLLAAENAYKHTLFLKWLNAKDESVVSTAGIATRWDATLEQWSSYGKNVLDTRDPRFTDAMARRAALAKQLREARDEERDAKAKAARDALEAWARKVDPAVDAGLKAGYEMNEAMGVLICAILADHCEDVASPDDWSQVVEGTEPWADLAVQRLDSPTEAELRRESATAAAIKAMYKDGMPEVVVFDTPEAMRCEPGDYGELYRAIVVTCNAPGLKTRYFVLST